MNSPRIAALAAELGRSLEAFEGVMAVYVFGGAVWGSDPSDTDLVIVYGTPLPPLTAPTVRCAVEDAVARTIGLPPHLMFFSEREAREPGLMTKLEPLL